MLKALLFDVDGTLISIPPHIHRDIIIPYFLKFGKFTEREYFEALEAAKKIYKTSRKNKLIGRYLLFLLGEVSRRLGIRIGRRKLNEMYEFVWKRNIEQELLLDNSHMVLPELKKKFRLYVVTGRDIKHTKISLKKFNISHNFTAIYTPDKHKALKESGELFRIFLKTTKLRPQECLMIGDRPDVDGTSMNYGIRFCLVDRRNKYGKARYDFRIRNLRGLAKVLSVA